MKKIYRFVKRGRIKTQGKTYECVCVDKECAIFAPLKGNTVRYKNMFAVDSDMEKAKKYNFKFELL